MANVFYLTFFKNFSWNDSDAEMPVTSKALLDRTLPACFVDHIIQVEQTSNRRRRSLPCDTQRRNNVTSRTRLIIPSRRQIFAN